MLVSLIPDFWGAVACWLQARVIGVTRRSAEDGGGEVRMGF